MPQRLEQHTLVIHGPWECWEWTGRRNADGYGMVYHEGRNRPAHCAVFEAHRGPIPAGLVLDHLCRNRPCVRPEHMDPVPQKVNVHRGVSPAAYAWREWRNSALGALRFKSAELSVLRPILKRYRIARSDEEYRTRPENHIKSLIDRIEALEQIVKQHEDYIRRDRGS